MIAKDIMSTPVVTVTPDTPVPEVAGILAKHGINAVPVVGKFGELVGILSEVDILRRESPQGHHLFPRRRRPRATTAGEAMSTDVVTAQENSSVSEIARRMLENDVMQIPVVSGVRVVGIVARSDVLKALVRSDEEIRVRIEELLSDPLLMLGPFRASVAGGLVTLSTPRDPAERRLAELLARSVPGVVDVRFEGSH